MCKRTHKKIIKRILNELKDGQEYSYGSLERKVNTNWKKIRDNIELLLTFESVNISEDNKISITKFGKKCLKKLEESSSQIKTNRLK